MMQPEPQSSQAINRGFGVEVLKPYGTAIGEPVRTLVMTEQFYRTCKPVADLRAARSLGAGRASMFLRVILPAAVPYILSGVRIGIGTAFIVVIVSGMIAVNSGLGYRILEAREYFWSDKITIGLLGLAIDIGVNRLNNYLLRWHRGLEH
jgi:ABC-type nitrate/sulfonate/bicarbonate transport system permease component